MHYSEMVVGSKYKVLYHSTMYNVIVLSHSTDYVKAKYVKLDSYGEEQLPWSGPYGHFAHEYIMSVEFLEASATPTPMPPAEVVDIQDIPADRELLVGKALELAQEAFRAGSFEYGADARFIRIDSQWGVKLFRKEITRDMTYDFQRLTSHYGFAPMAQYKLEFEYDGQKWWGYLTETVVETGKDFYAGLKALLGKRKDWDVWEHAKNVRDAVEKAKTTMLRKQRLNIQDTHELNYGLMPDGSVVIFDFSRTGYVDGELAAFA